MGSLPLEGRAAEAITVVGGYCRQYIGCFPRLKVYTFRFATSLPGKKRLARM